MISDNSPQKNKPENKYLLEIENLYKKNKIKKLEQKTRDLIKNYPNFYILYNILGISLIKQDKTEEAIINFKKAIKIKSDFFEAHNNLGNAYKSKKKYEEAIICYEKSLKIKPNYAEAYNNLGIVLLNIKKIDESINSYLKAIEINPNYSEAYSNLGNLYDGLGKHEEAILYYEKALKIKPNYAEVHSNLGNAYDGLGKFDKAVKYHKESLKINPEYAAAYSNLGQVYDHLRKFDEAFICFEKALKIEPDHFDINCYESLTRLKLGDFETGWKKFEYRWHLKDAQNLRHQNMPLWLGKENISNKKILVWSEQGLGDNIQFCRYITKIIGMGAEVTFEVQNSLKTLMESISKKLKVVSIGNVKEKFDFQVPLMSLPLVFKTNFQTIPNKIPYLNIPEKLVKHWSNILGPKKKPRIGLTWSGNKNYRGDKLRSIKLKTLLPLLSNRYDFFCLQKDIREEDREDFNNSSIKYYGDEDFLNTGAIIRNLDLVITSDTATPHLSGALNFPTWILIPYSPDWRWLIGYNYSPWYPSLKLLRQNKVNQWENIIKKIIDEMNLLT